MEIMSAVYVYTGDKVSLDGIKKEAARQAYYQMVLVPDPSVEDSEDDSNSNGGGDNL